MRYLLVLLSFGSFFLFISPAQAAVITGVQLPSAKTIKRLTSSQYGFQWIKYQYQLGTDPQALKDLIDKTTTTVRSAGNKYQVLISIAKNQAGIETLKNPGTDYQPEQPDTWFSHKYCPWPEELETYTYDCGTDAYGNVKKCSVTARPKTDNGYLKFRDKLKELAPSLQGAGAVEIWNEPNLAFEWKDQGLGDVNPQNYANFLICGIKGLKRGGYSGTMISAGMAPLPPTNGTNMNDEQFFNSFYSYLLTEGKLKEVDAFGWHSNVTDDITPEASDKNGFQRFQIATSKKAKPVWLTEYGWRRDAFGSEEQTIRQKQGEYISRAYTVANDTGNQNTGGIEAMFVWNFGFATEALANPQLADMRLWDIEGTIPQGDFCQPNESNPKISKLHGDSKYVQDQTLTDDASIASIAGKALIPEIVSLDVAQKTATFTGTKVDVTESFASKIAQIVLQQFNVNICGLSGFLGIIKIPIQVCQPNLSVGIAEVAKPSEELAPGKNTQEFSARAKILGKTAIPEGMTLIPAKRDCNIGKLTKEIDTEGDQKLNDLSENLGTTTGFYGNDIPDFRSIASQEFESSLSARMADENLNISNKLFSQDERSPDICLQKKGYTLGSYPVEVFPAGISCDEVWKIFLKINASQFPSKIGT